jgi:hypothetical protein
MPPGKNFVADLTQLNPSVDPCDQAHKEQLAKSCPLELFCSLEASACS